MDTAILIAIIAAIVAPPLTVGLPLAVFQWRQNAALEKRLTANAESVENRLRGDIQTVKDDLSDEIKAVENRLNRRIDEVEERLTSRIDEVEERLTSRINTTDNNVIHLIGEVGLVKGAVLGISAEGAPREPVSPN